MAGSVLELALVHEVFHGNGAAERLRARLTEARQAGAELAVLPELPLDRWVPATRTVAAEDAEEPGGPRHRLLAAAARGAGIGLLGGAITREGGRRFNRALLFGAAGELVARYDKLHLPCEEGFWESDHYEPGESVPRPCGGFPLKIGLQICSDLNRPQAVLLLAARGAEVILAPRATPPQSYDRWRTVIRADAITGACHVVSTNRPSPEQGVAIGGPSLAVAPDGEVLAETTDALTFVSLDGGVVERARRDYPGYLDIRADLYAGGWAEP